MFCGKTIHWLPLKFSPSEKGFFAPKRSFLLVDLFTLSFEWLHQQADICEKFFFTIKLLICLYLFLVFHFKHVLREADRRVVMKPIFRINIKAVRHSCAFMSKGNSLRQVGPSFRSQIFSLMPQIRHWKERKLVTNSRYRPDIWTMCATFTFMMDFLMVNHNGQWSNDTIEPMSL